MLDNHESRTWLKPMGEHGRVHINMTSLKCKWSTISVELGLFTYLSWSHAFMTWSNQSNTCMLSKNKAQLHGIGVLGCKYIRSVHGSQWCTTRKLRAMK